MTLQPTVAKRPAGERSRLKLDWLNARYTFSFGDYMDPSHMGFRSLRVMNNDIIEPGGGFGTHPHKDAEIFTYIIEGNLEHRDSMGNGSVIAAGNLQYMSAGSGVRHSEFNPSDSERVHLYQIWLMPNESGGEPRYAEIPLGEEARANDLTLLFSGQEKEGVTQIRQDAEIYFGKLDTDQSVQVPLSDSMPHAWVQVIKGGLNVLGESLSNADGLAIENAPEGFEIEASTDSQFLLFRLS